MNMNLVEHIEQIEKSQNNQNSWENKRTQTVEMINGREKIDEETHIVLMCAIATT